MISVAKEWNPKQALLKSIIQTPGRFDDAVRLCLDMHSMVHASEVSQSETGTYEDILWDELDDEAFRMKPAEKDVTIAWNIWHQTRIEDITANILIADRKQVINCDNWLERMNTKVCDTGNAMTGKEITALSTSLNMGELRNYRMAVGRKTREIIMQLEPKDMKRKFESSSLQRILNEGAVLEVEDSRWLVGFWGKKTVAGILLMPITRHQIVHINDSLRLKEKYLKINGL